jgi:hypothetical protein
LKIQIQEIKVHGTVVEQARPTIKNSTGRRRSGKYGSPNQKDEDAPVYASQNQGWIDNGAGWLLAGFIEERNGSLRPQTPSELTQCVGCHSGNGPQEEIAYSNFTSVTGNTIDSTWALVRQLPRELDWREMDYLTVVVVSGLPFSESHSPLLSL